MSNKEIVQNLIDQIPENKLIFIIPYLQGYLQGATILDEIPNIDTIEAIQEIKNKGGHRFIGTTEDLFQELMED